MNNETQMLDEQVVNLALAFSKTQEEIDNISNNYDSGYTNLYNRLSHNRNQMFLTLIEKKYPWIEDNKTYSIIIAGKKFSIKKRILALQEGKDIVEKITSENQNTKTSMKEIQEYNEERYGKRLVYKDNIKSAVQDYGMLLEDNSNFDNISYLGTVAAIDSAKNEVEEEKQQRDEAIKNLERKKEKRFIDEKANKTLAIDNKADKVNGVDETNEADETNSTKVVSNINDSDKIKDSLDRVNLSLNEVNSNVQKMGSSVKNIENVTEHLRFGNTPNIANSNSFSFSNKTNKNNKEAENNVKYIKDTLDLEKQKTLEKELEVEKEKQRKQEEALRKEKEEKERLRKEREKLELEQKEALKKKQEEERKRKIQEENFKKEFKGKIKDIAKEFSTFEADLNKKKKEEKEKIQKLKEEREKIFREIDVEINETNKLIEELKSDISAKDSDINLFNKKIEMETSESLIEIFKETLEKIKQIKKDNEDSLAECEEKIVQSQKVKEKEKEKIEKALNDLSNNGKYNQEKNIFLNKTDEKTNKVIEKYENLIGLDFIKEVIINSALPKRIINDFCVKFKVSSKEKDKKDNAKNNEPKNNNEKIVAEKSQESKKAESDNNESNGTDEADENNKIDNKVNDETNNKTNGEVKDSIIDKKKDIQKKEISNSISESFASDLNEIFNNDKNTIGDSKTEEPKELKEETVEKVKELKEEVKEETKEEVKSSDLILDKAKENVKDSESEVKNTNNSIDSDINGINDIDKIINNNAKNNDAENGINDEVAKNNIDLGDEFKKVQTKINNSDLLEETNNLKDFLGLDLQQQYPNSNVSITVTDKRVKKQDNKTQKAKNKVIEKLNADEVNFMKHQFEKKGTKREKKEHIKSEPVVTTHNKAEPLDANDKFEQDMFGVLNYSVKDTKYEKIIEEKEKEKENVTTVDYNDIKNAKVEETENTSSSTVKKQEKEVQEVSKYSAHRIGHGNHFAAFVDQGFCQIKMNVEQKTTKEVGEMTFTVVLYDYDKKYNKFYYVVICNKAKQVGFGDNSKNAKVNLNGCIFNFKVERVNENDFICEKHSNFKVTYFCEEPSITINMKETRMQQRGYIEHPCLIKMKKGDIEYSYIPLRFKNIKEKDYTRFCVIETESNKNNRTQENSKVYFQTKNSQYVEYENKQCMAYFDENRQFCVKVEEKENM